MNYPLLHNFILLRAASEAAGRQRVREHTLIAVKMLGFSNYRFQHYRMQSVHQFLSVSKMLLRNS